MFEIHCPTGGQVRVYDSFVFHTMSLQSVGLPTQTHFPPGSILNPDAVCRVMYAWFPNDIFEINLYTLTMWSAVISQAGIDYTAW